MSANTVVLQGIVQPDGTLQLNGKVALPAGKVQVTVSAVSTDHPFWQMMQEIWDARQQAGLQPRSVEAIEVERQQFRDEVDEEIAEAGRLQDECQRLHQDAEKPNSEAQRSFVSTRTSLST